MLLHSIRFKLTVWFVLTVTLIMLADALIWDRTLARIMMDNIDGQLLLTAEEIENFHLRRTGGVAHDATLCAWTEDFVHRYNWGVSIQQMSPQGELICSTDNLHDSSLPYDRAAWESLSVGLPVFKTYDKVGGGRLRVVTYAVRVKGRIDSVLQVGKDMSANDSYLADLKQSRLIFMPLLVLGLGGCGWLFAGRALAPLQRITSRIRKITAEKLNERLPVDESPNELTLLSQSFNDMLERIADSFNRVRQFTGDASHELRTPLAILKGETEVAMRWAKGEEELRATLASNLEEIDRMERITEDLLYLAKSETGEFRLTLARFSLNDMLQDLYLVGNTLGDPKGIQVTLWLNVNEEVFIVADQMHLHRALLNLVTNAVKYTPDGGKVELSLDLGEDDAARICVRDTGIGIPEEHLPHIFERFYRVDEARNRSIGGTGLGLAIVKAIVTAHQGTIVVTSIPNRGSEFVVRLPLAGPVPRSQNQT